MCRPFIEFPFSCQEMTRNPPKFHFMQLVTLQTSQVKRTPQNCINEFIIRKLSPLAVVDFRFILYSCMRNEAWIHTRFSYEISTSSVSLNLMYSKNFNSFKDFQSDQIQTSSRKLSTAHYACSNSDLNWTPVTGTTNGFIFQIINSLI